MLFVSPAEQQPTLKALGTSASWVESYGVDYFWIAHGETYGIQRKDVKDLVASLHDDRLARELSAMAQLHRAFLLIEGDWKWVRGRSSRESINFTRAQYIGILCAVQLEHGVGVIESSGIRATVDIIPRVVNWTEKADHGSLRNRSAAPRVSIRDQAVWLLQGAGFGRKTAEAVYDHFGKLPLSPLCTYEELCAVPGVGPKRARAFMDRFGHV